MSYFFKYICLENKHLIKQINFNIYNILLIGKTNVGKSTLINEFLGLKKVKTILQKRERDVRHLLLILKNILEKEIMFAIIYMILMAFN